MLLPECSALPLNRFFFRKGIITRIMVTEKVSRQVSHLVKHTDIIPSSRTSVRVIVMVMKLWTSHVAQAGFAHVARTAGSHVSRRWHPWRAAGTSHVRGLSSGLNGFAVIDLCHSAHTSTPQSRILVAVAPTVHSPLNQSSLAAKARIQICQGPTNCVALVLVNQAVSTLLFFAAASSWVHAVLSLELCAEGLNVDRLDVASDGVLHLDTIARVFERDPLNTIVVLTNNEWSGSRNRARGRVWVDPASSSRTWRIVLLHRWAVWSMLLLLLLRLSQRYRWPRNLRDVGFHLRSWTSRHSLLRMLLAGVLLHLMLAG